MISVRCYILNRYITSMLVIFFFFFLFLKVFVPYMESFKKYEIYRISLMFHVLFIFE